MPGRSRGPIVIGVGNELRRDDGCGIAVARAARAALGPAVEAVELTGEPASLLDAWEGRDLAVVVDATRGGGTPGRVRRWDGTDMLPSDTEAVASTHGLSLAAAVALGEALGRMPRRLIVYGIEAGDVGEGVGLTAAVAGAIGPVVDRIRVEVAAPAAARPLGRSRHA